MFRTKYLRRAFAALTLVAAVALGFHPSGTAHKDAGIRWQAMVATATAAK